MNSALHATDDVHHTTQTCVAACSAADAAERSSFLITVLPLRPVECTNRSETTTSETALSDRCRLSWVPASRWRRRRWPPRRGLAAESPRRWQASVVVTSWQTRVHGTGEWWCLCQRQSSSWAHCRTRHAPSPPTIYVHEHLHCDVSEKRHWCSTHYNFNAHQPIFVIFGRDAAERICYRTVIWFFASPN